MFYLFVFKSEFTQQPCDPSHKIKMKCLSKFKMIYFIFLSNFKII